MIKQVSIIRPYIIRRSVADRRCIKFIIVLDKPNVLPIFNIRVLTDFNITFCERTFPKTFSP